LPSPDREFASAMVRDMHRHMESELSPQADIVLRRGVYHLYSRLALQKKTIARLQAIIRAHELDGDDHA